MSESKSWYARIFGRSLIAMIFGNFFEKKSNSSSIIAIMLVATLCFVVIHTLCTKGDISKELTIITNIIFVVIGYYFGSKQENVVKEDE